ncbi:MAG: L,D-transpeptidase family protein [Pseudomonadota bacterium]
MRAVLLLLRSQLFILSILFLTLTIPAAAQVTVFKQAIAEAAATDEALTAFYKARAYEPIWTGSDREDRKRRAALLEAAKQAGAHGLPGAQYDPENIKARIRAARSAEALGALEVYLSKLFLDYARDVQTGILTPASVDKEIVRSVPYRDRQATMEAFAKSSAIGFMNALPPKSPEYARLMRQKVELERLLAGNGWGPTVPGGALKPDQSGQAVVALRNRLIAMGFMGRSNSQTYDAKLGEAVTAFQEAHGLEADGVAGAGTLAEINKSPADRLTQVLVAMERERWINKPLGDRHIWVNLTDFSAMIVDGGKVTFQTRSVIGAHDKDRRSPEFSDEMDHMVINPSWYVPRSIATKEYLPQLRNNPNAVSHLEITDSRGRVVNRAAANFANYTPQNFPYNMRQPPSRQNALGLVKFMFPNKWNIYLHDTPAKNLFAREVRAFSHGCIRLNDPFDFAYALLAEQEASPKDYFQSILRTGQERRVDLEQPVPVHLVYRTAFTTPTGHMNYRRDVYGRDAKIWNALSREGVALGAVGG